MSDAASGSGPQSGQPAPSGQPAGIASGGKAPAFGQRPAAEPQAKAPSTLGHFHSYKGDDGKEEIFNTPDDLNRALREGRLRHQDYTKKTQEVAQLRKSLEQQQSDLEQRVSLALRMENQWKPVDDWLKGRPDIVGYIRSQMGVPAPGVAQEQSRGALEEALKPYRQELDELKKFRSQQEEEARLTAVIEGLKGRYTDFDETAFSNLYSTLDEAPEGEEMRALAEILYWATKGKASGVKPPVAVGTTPGVPPVTNGAPKLGPGQKWNFEMARKRARAK